MRKFITTQFFILVLFVFNAFAQIPPDVYLPDYDGWKSYQKKVEEKFENQIEKGRWDKVFEFILKDFENSNVDWTGKEDVKKKAEKEMKNLIKAYKETVINSLLKAKTEELIGKFLDQYATGIFQPDVSSGFVIFFSQTENEIKILPQILNEKQAKEIRDKLQTINALLHKLKEKERKKVISAIKKAEKRWRSYIFNGFSQYPWEALLNGHLTSFDIQHPPKLQYLLLHPELSFEVKTDNLQAKIEVLTVEVIGILRYQNEWKNFYGLSLIVNMRDDLGAGVGALVHYNMYSLGIVWHDIDDDGNRFDDPPFLTVGIDLYKLFENKNSRLNQYIEKIFSTK